VEDKENISEGYVIDIIGNAKDKTIDVQE